MKVVTNLGMLALSIFAAAPAARAETVDYTITFNGTGPTPTSGSFTYDAATATFSNFDIVIGGITTDISASLANIGTLTANNLGIGSCSGEFGAQLAFDILAGACTDVVTADWALDAGSPESILQFQDFYNMQEFVTPFVMTEGLFIETPGFPTGDNGTGTWTISPSAAVPEPGTMPTMVVYAAAGLGSWVWYRRRRVKGKVEARGISRTT